MTRNFILKGQVRSGKNNMQITRSGLHFPKPEWASWRDQTVRELIKQMGTDDWQAVGQFLFEVQRYTPADRRRRDVPGMIDALFHCFEKAGIVKDDSMITSVFWTRNEYPSKEKAGIVFSISRMGD